MERYKNTGGNSGISFFETGTDYILVKFSDTARPYKYSYQKAGCCHVEKMKALARKGSGLNTYINQYVKDLYD
ncbi:hypothetical protein A8C56_20920 [Niabella ginsenosidivorans]|uniref:KTSC domain-containing protein n=1 Tax=Niabella ginsenosidivorans TaxID=1176587 RepID=A0A1A9I6B4_9BACT|nr:hypothetical protein [Niabella ginsenosidivorans]ANH83113.1 hypothetical protein A8C56_20920 [Niabella ginsenosidivorans]